MERLQLYIPEIQNTSRLSMQSYQDSLLLIGTGGAGVVMYSPVSRSSQDADHA
ncbi:MAG: hypothetical protein QM762_30235 [Chryseolinea sp.]